VRAFVNRPQLVEHADGFQGLDVYADSRDASFFYLSTRWATELEFRQWHSSEAHQTSHQGIPKGLKLDPEFTQMVVLNHLCN